MYQNREGKYVIQRGLFSAVLASPKGAAFHWNQPLLKGGSGLRKQGPLGGVFPRGFRRWGLKGIWELVFRLLSIAADVEELMLDATIVRAHQHAAGAQKRKAGP